MSALHLASDDPRQIAGVVTSWCEKTSDSPIHGTRALMAGTAALCAHAAARGQVMEARVLGRRFLAFEAYLAYLEGGR